MSTIFGLAKLSLSKGSYSITAVAKAEGYADSVESEAVQYEGPDELAGTWVFIDDVTISVSGGSQITYNVNFTTEGGSSTADCIKLVNTGEPYHSALAYQIYYCGGNMGDEKVYSARYSDSNGSWYSERYRTITITSTLAEVTNGEALLTWLKANATKIA